MEPSPGTVDLASLAPPLRALVEGQQATVEALRAEVASLTDRNRRLQEQGPEALVEDLHARVVSLTDRNRNLEDRNRRPRTPGARAATRDVREEVREAPSRPAPARLRKSSKARSPRPRPTPRRARRQRRARSARPRSATSVICRRTCLGSLTSSSPRARCAPAAAAR